MIALLVDRGYVATFLLGVCVALAATLWRDRRQSTRLRDALVALLEAQAQLVATLQQDAGRPPR